MGEFCGILCHGTEADFDQFDLSFCNDGGAMGRGFYFTNDIELGGLYSGGRDPIVATITMRNPYHLDSNNVTFAERLEWARVFRRNGAREQLIADGYDGVLYCEDTYIEAIVFFPEQIESYGRRPSLENVESFSSPSMP